MWEMIWEVISHIKCAKNKTNAHPMHTLKVAGKKKMVYYFLSISLTKIKKICRLLLIGMM